VGLSGDLASSIGLVIAFRVAQGIFGAMLQPTALALLRKNFPAEKLNAALGIWGAVIGASTAAGPIVGGLLVQHVNWEACFYINVPVGLIALAMSWLVLRETDPSPAARSFDIPGIALLSGALFALIWALIKGADYGWGSGRTMLFFGGAALAGLLFIVRESRAKEPLLPLRLFRSVPLSAGVVLVLMLMFSLFGAMFFMTFFLENVHGLGAVATGVRLLPLTAMLIVASPVSGKLITRFGPRIPLVAGMLLAAVALFGLSRIGIASSLNDTIGWFALLGLGLSPVMVGGTDVIVGNASVQLAGVAGGLQSTAMQLGGTLGRRPPAHAHRIATGRREEPDHGRSGPGDLGHTSPDGRPDRGCHPHHVHQRHERRLPGRLHRRPGRRRHRAADQARPGHRRHRRGVSSRHSPPPPADRVRMVSR
jgi:EmrB/QacA subfamily drug resistance transporter